ncbi:hypothetical protein M0811_12683 [Anaeramoeba ignava]|nr:hypothetical protein M0811_12683 [Anaeramoeba ignava]
MIPLNPENQRYIEIVVTGILSLIIFHITKKTNIKLLVFVHSILSSISAVSVYFFNLKPHISMMITIVYLPYHTYFIKEETYSSHENWTTVAHHAFGFFFGATELVIKKNEMTYVAMQINEFSTIFLTIYRWKTNTITGLIFALSFFWTRLYWDTIYVLSHYYLQSSLYIQIICIPFYAIQYYWVWTVIKNIIDAVKKPKAKKD